MPKRTPTGKRFIIHDVDDLRDVPDDMLNYVLRAIASNVRYERERDPEHKEKALYIEIIDDGDAKNNPTEYI